MDNKRIHILLIEDNPGDVRMMTELLSESGVSSELHVSMDGADAIDFLKRRGGHNSAIQPDFIILDLNLPKKNGREVLAEIKQDEHLKTIPVIILSSSDADNDIEYCYSMQANCYINKPHDLFNYMHVVKSISEFWFQTVRLPRAS
jgi:chemotaxis family two-component system response regulator Rcp1